MRTRKTFQRHKLLANKPRSQISHADNHSGSSKRHRNTVSRKKTRLATAGSQIVKGGLRIESATNPTSFDAPEPKGTFEHGRQTKGTPLTSLIPPEIEPLGIVTINGYREKQLVLQIRNPHGDRIERLSLSDLVSGERRPLAVLMAEHGYVDLIERGALKDLAQTLILEAQSKSLVLLSAIGYQEIELDYKRYCGYVWDSKAYWFGDKPNQEVILMPNTIQATRSGSLRNWQDKIGKKLTGNHYLTVVHTHAMSAVIRRAFRMPQLTLSLVGPSSTGKTTTQNSALTQIGHPSGVRTMSGTPAGVRELVSAHPDMPIYFQDTRQFDTADLVDLIFDAADGAARVLSGQQKPPLAATLILSNERHIIDMPKVNGLLLDEGFYARCVEISCIAPYGAFHCLHGMPSPADFSKQLDKDSHECYGTVWPAWINALSTNWSKILQLHAKWGPMVRDKLVAKAGDFSNTRISNRILDGLAFSAWTGVIASHLNILPITRAEVIEAYSLVLRQLLSERQIGTTPLATQLFDVLRSLLASSGSRFNDLRSFDQASDSPGLLGYRTNHKEYGCLYLFMPNVFRERFVVPFGRVAYDLLADAGYLVTGKSRGHQFLVRIPGTDHRASFVAIKESIRHA